MTKSGIGTASLAPTTNGPNGMSSTNGGTMLTNGTMSANSISHAEIPIWVADKKKWVTGISKKTTVNDLIHAILKQCQITVPPASAADSTVANHYVLVEFDMSSSSSDQQQLLPPPTVDSDNQHINSQKIIDGDSKVYKHLNKWLQHSMPTQQQPSNDQQQQQQQSTNYILLKILQRQPAESNNSETVTTTTANSHHNHHQSLTSKILKKFGVSHQNQPDKSNVNTTSSTAATTTSTANLGGSSYRYVDVKLPKSTTTANLNSPQSSSSTSTSTTRRNSFDPNVQKSFVYTTIMERENRLKQQRERFQLIDEMIREAEKKSRLPSSDLLAANSLVHQQPQVMASLSSNSTSSTSSISPAQNNTNKPSNSSSNNNNNNNEGLMKSKSIIDLNDIYCYFPEMCTHQLNEVQDFTQMCSKLFALEETIQSQKQMLSSLECDLQRELNPSSTQPAVNHCMSPLPPSCIETPEMAELRKEVTLSREQTRLQCKQLHDLDAKMRTNEHSLMMREQQLQQLLEELYIQEIYADNALEEAIGLSNVHHPANAYHHQQHLPPLNNSQFFPANEISNGTPNLLVNGISQHHEYMGQNEPDMEMIETDENNKQRIQFIDMNNHQPPQQQSDQQPDGVELKILNKSEQQLKFDEVNFTQHNHSQLNNHHKSLSYGNLHQPQSQANDVMDSHQNRILLNKPMSTMKYLKTSPSLDLNSKMAGYMAAKNGGQNGTQDHSGDNDSGISSMSSETTTTTTKSSKCGGVNQPNSNVVSIPIMTSTATFYAAHQAQYNNPRVQVGGYHHHQPQFHSEQQFNSQAANQKSVLETLV